MFFFDYCEYQRTLVCIAYSSPDNSLAVKWRKGAKLTNGNMIQEFYIKGSKLFILNFYRLLYWSNFHEGNIILL